MRLYPALLIVSFLFCLDLTAQEEAPAKENFKIGVMSGYGFQDEPLLGLDYYYRVIFMGAQGYWTFFDKKSYTFDLRLEGQYNLTTSIYDSVYYTDKQKGYEYGMQVGVAFRRHFQTEALNLYLLLSVGPYYISDSLYRQAAGFVFSDNIAAGVNIKLVKSLYFDVSLGFRHVSDTGIKKPDGGINTVTVWGGVVVVL